MKRICITTEITPDQLFNLLGDSFRRYFERRELNMYIKSYISSDSITSVYQLLVKVINEVLTDTNVKVHFNNDLVTLDAMRDIIIKNMISLEYLQHELIKTDLESKFEYIGLKTAIINTFNVIKMCANSIANLRNDSCMITYKIDDNDHLYRLYTMALIFKHETIRYEKEYL